MLTVANAWATVPDATSTYVICGSTFTFHQVDMYNDRVYDPSTASLTGGPPFLNLTLANYLSTVFVEPTASNIVPTNVTTINIVNNAAGGLLIRSLSTYSVPVGAMRTITMTGAYFNTPGLAIRPYMANTTTADAGVTITDITVVDGNTVTFKVTVAAGHALGPNFDLVFTNAETEEQIRIPLTVVP
jgi:hypothetical protein